MSSKTYSNNDNGDDSSVEHEVIFLDEDDEDDDDTNASETEKSTMSNPQNQRPTSDRAVGSTRWLLSDPLRDFRPLDDAVDPEASWKAASSLETFLAVEERQHPRAHRSDGNPSSGTPSSSTALLTDRSRHATTTTTTTLSSFSSYPTSTAATIQINPTAARTPQQPQRFQQRPQQQHTTFSLLDGLVAEEEEPIESESEMELVQPSRLEGVYGAAGYLEMEEDPSVVASTASPTRLQPHPPQHSHDNNNNNNNKHYYYYEQPIQTASGLLLTHRRPVVSQSQHQQQQQQEQSSSSWQPQQSTTPTVRRSTGGRMPGSSWDHEDPSFAATPWFSGTPSKIYPHHHPHSNYSSNPRGAAARSSDVWPWQPATNSSSFSTTRLLRYVRWWVSWSALVLVVGTIVLVHHTRHNNTTTSSSSLTTSSGGSSTPEEGANGVISQQQQQQQRQQTKNLPLDAAAAADKIVLLPLPMLDSPDGGYHHPNNHGGGGNQAHVRSAPTKNKNRNQQQQQHRRLSGELQHNNVTIQQQHQQQPTLGMVHLPEAVLHHHHQPHHNDNMQDYLRDEFQAWMQKHNKKYHSHAEQQKRFHIWSENHHRTRRKNERHGPCRHTGRTVFGSNHLQDLTPDEFREQYLNAAQLSRQPHPLGYRPPPPLSEEQPEQPNGTPTPPRRHAIVQERYRQHVAAARRQQQQRSLASSSRSQRCAWYNVSCHLRYIFETYFYGFGRTMEPAYDANSYPTAVDWRDMGAVTDVHSQGSCGACWAITAVETVESVHFIATGELYDLAETEVIVCQDECEMCAGGWPQDAFDYVIDHGGLPLEKNMPYDSDFLLMVSEAVAGDSDQLDANTLNAYQQQTCPSGGRGKGGNSKDSNDSKDDNKNSNADAYYFDSSSANNYQRYGKISGYGYSTSKCVCYTDGSGCDCANQNEGMAVRNLATYGPAVVCLDASTWQDYTEGILSSDSGCSSGFMDVNHCVQAVGYAYFSDDDNDERNEERHSGDNKSGDHGSHDSGDRSKRTGYWIVRNQWSSYWGMSGFAYVSMGENTCGILNDMIQAYA